MGDVARNDSGQFQKGVSGNPSGRPKNVKNEITELKQDLELAVRQHVSVDQIKNIVDAMVTKAEKGSVQAAKLILDKTISNAKETEDVTETQGGIQVIVKNATLRVEPERESEPPPIEGELADE